MKSLLIFAGTLCFACTAFSHQEPSAMAEKLREEMSTVGVDAFTASSYKPHVVKHIVLFRYAKAVTSLQKDEIKNRFLALKDNCQRSGHPYIVSIETGAQSSGEGLDQQLEQGFIVTFNSEGDRNFYVGQPIVQDAKFYDQAHQKFKEFVGPFLHTPINPNGVLVFDFVLNK